MHVRRGQTPTYKDLILIRVDGNETIGMGHVSRCLTLAQTLSDQHLIRTEFATETDETSLSQIRERGFAAHPIPKGSSFSEQMKLLKVLAQTRGAQAVITDLRQMEPVALDDLKSSGLFIAVIDEWGHKRLSADIVFNGTVVSEWHRYASLGDLRRCLGPDYALLDPSFRDIHQARRNINAKVRSVLVALGGDDPFHLTEKALESIEQIAAPLEITVVIGPAFGETQAIEWLAQASRHPVHLLRNVRNMAFLMGQADLAIAGGGLTALEVACAGTPALILCEVDHQVETAQALEQAQAALSLGLGAAQTREAIARKIKNLLQDQAQRESLSQHGKQLVDGRGMERTVDLLIQALAQRRP